MMIERVNPFELLETVTEEYKGYVKEISTYIPMKRDGVKIAVDVSLPKNLEPGKKIPALLEQTRYSRSTKFRLPFRWLLSEDFFKRDQITLYTSAGFAFVYVDTRGSCASFGKRKHALSQDEVLDGKDIMDWIIEQPWSDGNIFPIGGSYTGISAELAGTLGHPSSKGIFACHSPWDVYEDIARPGGCYNAGFCDQWSQGGRGYDTSNMKYFVKINLLAVLLAEGTMPVREDKGGIQFKQAIQQHSENAYPDEYVIPNMYRDDAIDETGITYDILNLFKYKSKIEARNIPFFSVTSWFDCAYGWAALKRFLNFNNPQILIIGHWGHGPDVKIKYNNKPVYGLKNVELLKYPLAKFKEIIDGGSPFNGKILYYYTIGEDAWKKTTEWPPVGVKEEIWYLQDGGVLDKKKTGEECNPVEYRVDFNTTSGKQNRWHSPLGIPPHFKNRTKKDAALPCFTSKPLECKLEITGHPIVHLQLASTREDGMIIVYLEEVMANGNVCHLSEGVLRLVHRKVIENPPCNHVGPYHSFKKEDAMPMVPGEYATISIGMQPISALLQEGSKIRVVVAGADKDSFPSLPEDENITYNISTGRDKASFINLPVISS